MNTQQFIDMTLNTMTKEDFIAPEDQRVRGATPIFMIRSFVSQQISDLGLKSTTKIMEIITHNIFNHLFDN